MGAVRFASRALKTACGAVFARRGTQSSGPGCSNPPAYFRKIKAKQKRYPLSGIALLVELVDSNHRSIKQQIYSLSPLATRESSHILFCSVAALRVAQCLIIIAKRNRKCKPFFQFFCDFFQKSFLCTLHRAIFKKKECPSGVRRGAPRGISEDRRRIMYICNGIVALLVVWPGPSDCSGMAQGTVCMIAGCFPRLSFDYDT